VDGQAEKLMIIWK